jgi:hypothetical protein
MRLNLLGGKPEQTIKKDSQAKRQIHDNILKESVSHQQGSHNQKQSSQRSSSVAHFANTSGLSK